MSQNYMIPTKLRFTFRFPYLLAILILWRCAFCTVTLVSIYSVNIQIMLFFVWLLLNIATDRTYIGVLLSKGKYLIAFILIIAIVDLIVVGNLSTQTRTFILLFMAYSIMIAYRKGHQTFVKLILLLLLVDYCYAVYNYFQLLALDPMYARIFSSGNQEGIAGVGGYVFIYATTMLFSYLIAVLAEKSNFRMKHVVLIFLCIVQFILIMRAMYYIAIITAIACVIFTLIPVKRKWKIAITVILFVFMYILKNPLAMLILNIAHSTSDGFTANKLTEISGYLTKDSISSFSSTSRIGLVVTSIRAFVEHPVLGVYNFEANNLYIRGHSGIFDLLSDYGILRVTPMLIFMCLAWKDILKNAPLFSHDAIKLSIAAFIFVGVFNPIFSSQILLVVFVVIPFLSEWFDYKMVYSPVNI